MARILCKIPTRTRPSEFDATLQSFVEMQSSVVKVTYLISLDNDDDSMREYVDAKKEWLEDIGARVVWGERAGKIGSVNRDMEYAPEDYDVVMQTADDFRCLEFGWNSRIMQEISVFDNLDGVVWFYDGFQPNIDTLSIMGRKYYERFNYIYYPEYRTFWADNEFTEVADRLDRLVFCDDVLFVHEHPDWTHSRGYTGVNEGYDELYKENDKPEDRDWDEKLFHDRKANNFGLDGD